MSVTVVALLPAASSGAASDGRPGVTSREIRVGGVATVTGAADRDYASAFDGAAAYFDSVNRESGVFGRRLRLVARLDDGGASSRNLRAVRELVAQRSVFAILPVSTRSFFGARYLVERGTPVFGWNVNPEWTTSPAFFGDRGSYTCSTCPAVGAAYAAKQLGVSSVAVLARSGFRAGVCGTGLRDGFDKYGFNVVAANGDYAGDIAAAVEQVEAQGATLVATCALDLEDVAELARAIKRAGLQGVRVLATDAYEPVVLAQRRKALNGVIVELEFAPWEMKRPPAGTREFLHAMKRRHVAPTPAAQAGWIGAQLLVEGIKAAGRDFTQQSVIEAINAMTDFTAGGILPGINWASGGHGPGRERCRAYVEVVDGRFVPRYGKPFVCFPDNPLPGSLDAAVLRPDLT